MGPEKTYIHLRITKLMGNVDTYHETMEQAQEQAKKCSYGDTVTISEVKTLERYMKRIILGIAGRKGVGKSFVSSALHTAIQAKSIWVYETCFAEGLKKICTDVLLLSKEGIYGDDIKKNQLTKYTWERMPPHIRKDRTGPMTYREVMQTVGTEMMRDMFDPNIWIESTFARINEQSKAVNIINDVRFENEIEEIKRQGGQVWFVTGEGRGDVKFRDDSHPTEKELNPALFDFIINNGPDDTAASIVKQAEQSALFKTF